MDTITLKALRCRAIIGTLPAERKFRQELLIDVELSLDLGAAATSDDLTDTVDYSEIERRIVAVAENSQFQLLEALNGAIGAEIMREERIFACRVAIFKAAASRYGAGVTVTRNYSR